MARSLAVFLLTLPLPFVVGTACNADNCLRALRATQIPGRLQAAQSFCSTFTQLPVTATAAIPTYAVAACTGNVASRVSSACSCIATSVAPTLTITLITSTSSSSLPPTSAPSGVLAGPKVCTDPQLSCHNTTAVADLCCFNSPGGQLLATSFWDTAPSTGPNNSWTVHGLWPDHCDGTYDSFCDPAREYTNITAILESYGKADLLAYMNVYWKDQGGDDESFWEHEWNKHGTCISTLEPSCYNDYTNQEEVADFFQKAVDMFSGLDSYNVLANAGVLPSSTITYTFDQIMAPLRASHGYNITIQCTGNQLDELWYQYNVLGSVQTGEFVPAPPVGETSSCPDTGIQYLPKYSNTTSSTTTSTSALPSSTGVPYSGKGYLQAYTSGSNDGCLISAGTWYTTGTCATYTATTTASGFTLNSSKGPCGISNSTFTCATSVTASTFTAINDSLAYDGSINFYAPIVPTGSIQEKVSIAPNAVDVSFKWQSV